MPDDILTPRPTTVKDAELAMRLLAEQSKARIGELEHKLRIEEMRLCADRHGFISRTPLDEPLLERLVVARDKPSAFEARVATWVHESPFIRQDGGWLVLSGDTMASRAAIAMATFRSGYDTRHVWANHLQAYYVHRRSSDEIMRMLVAETEKQILEAELLVVDHLGSYCDGADDPKTMREKFDVFHLQRPDGSITVLITKMNRADFASTYGFNAITKCADWIVDA